MKILIIALSGIGDALMFTPAIKKIKQIQPDAAIETLVMFKGVKEFYERDKNISAVHYFDFLNHPPASAFKYVLNLRSKKYDASISVYPANRWEYNMISFLIGSKRRAAINYLRYKPQNLYFLNNVLVKENDVLHNVEENIRLVEKLFDTKIDSIPKLNFPLLEDDFEAAAKFLNEKNVEKKDLKIGFHAGCQTLKNHINRRWAPEKFAQLGEKLIEAYNCKLLLFGGPDETELKNTIQGIIKSENVIDVKTSSLAHSAAIIKECDLFVTNDSGLMHVSAAMQKKVIAIIGPTNTNYITPWQTEHKIASLNLDCSPCFYYSPTPLKCSREDVQFKCVKELEVDQVFSCCEELLSA